MARPWRGRASAAAIGGKAQARSEVLAPGGQSEERSAQEVVVAQTSMSSMRSLPQQRVLFVGNSQTYQPKELGGLPGAVSRLASGALGFQVQCDAVTQGGADLLDVWEAVEARVRGAVAEGERTWDVVVLQAGRGGTVEARFMMEQALEHRYGPLLIGQQSTCRVVLYQNWADPGVDPRQEESFAAMRAYRSALIASGVADVRIAWVGEAFQQLREDTAVDRHLYPALFKDDMGHPSAFAGLLMAAVVAPCLAPNDAPPSCRPLGPVLEAMLPAAWRTASLGYAGVAEFGQKGWLDGRRTLPAGLVEEDDEDLGPLAGRPPGTRTERRDLGLAPGDAIAAVAVLVARTCDSGVAARPEMAKAAQAEPPAAGTSKRRWRKG